MQQTALSFIFNLTKTIPINLQNNELLDYIYLTDQKVALLKHNKIIVLNLKTSQRHDINSSGHYLLPLNDGQFIAINQITNVAIVFNTKFKSKSHSVDFQAYNSGKYFVRSGRVVFSSTLAYVNSLVEMKFDKLVYTKIGSNYDRQKQKMRISKSLNEIDTVIVSTEKNSTYGVYSLSTFGIVKEIHLPLKGLMQDKEEALNIYEIDDNQVIIGYIQQTTFKLAIVILSTQKLDTLIQFSNVRFGHFNSINLQNNTIAFSLCVKQNVFGNKYTLFVYNYFSKRIQWQHVLDKVIWNQTFGWSLVASSIMSSDIKNFVEVVKSKEGKCVLNLYQRFSKKSLYFHLNMNSHLKQAYSDCLIRAVFKVFNI